MVDAVAALGLPDCWVGAGFVRAAVWDRLHGYTEATPLADIDIVYFDPSDTTTVREDRLERALLQRNLELPWPDIWWSVRNQARMHHYNGDDPYSDTEDAMRHWLETPTAVDIRLTDDRAGALLAPFGVEDLFELAVRPTPHARENRMPAYRERVAKKAWQETWPRLTIYD